MRADGAGWAPGRGFSELVQERVATDPAYSEALLLEALSAVLASNVHTVKAINASLTPAYLLKLAQT